MKDEMLMSSIETHFFLLLYIFSTRRYTHVSLTRLPFFDAIAIDVPFVVVVRHVGVTDQVVRAVHASVEQHIR